MSDLAATNCGGCGGCDCNGGCNSCIWIIILLLLCGGCNNGSFFGNGCDNGCDCIWIIILLIFCCGCGNNGGGCGGCGGCGC